MNALGSEEKKFTKTFWDKMLLVGAAILIVIIGGLSSVPGVLIAGFLYGALNYMAFYYASTWAPALIYGSLILLLLWRPQGLFGLGMVVRK